jgi:(p)ppGpp synthase/HD superfamily hydrolase
MAKAPSQPGVEEAADSSFDPAALRFAREAHDGQRRNEDGRPFIDHPQAVARLLIEAGYDDDIVAAAYLHDVVEKTEIDTDSITDRFGPEVSRLVAALSEDTSVDSYVERKRALREAVLAAGRPTTNIYAADRLANVRDWRKLPKRQREQAADRLGTQLGDRLMLWDEDLRDLTAFDDGLPFLGEIEIELRALRADATA